jgi:molybdopterin-guanine dinucleotide biosynthesis protein A
MIELSISAVIISGGYSKRFGRDKALVKLMGKPLIKHVFEKVQLITKNIVIVVSTEKQSLKYSRIFNQEAKIVIDMRKERSPLIGTFTGLSEADEKYVILLPCDTPLVSENFLNLLIKNASGKSAVIPRRPNSHIEPLQAVYLRKEALKSAEKVLSKGKLRMRSMISELSNVHYLSTLIINRVDPYLHTFLNINTIQDLKSAESFLRLQKTQEQNS